MRMPSRSTSLLSRSSRLSRVLLAMLLLAFGSTAGPAVAQDAAEVSVRVNRMENQIRQLSGQIEQLQFENRRLTDQLKRFQEDVDFRLNERGGARSPAPAGSTSPGTTGPGAPPQNLQRPRQSNTPGVTPGASNTPPVAGIIDNGGPGSGQPLDVSGGRQPPGGALAPAGRTGASVAATAPGTPRQAYDLAYSSITTRQYEDAEMGFRQFLQSHPRDRLVPAATFWLGESYFRRNRHKDAAEQYLKVTTDHSRAAIAPDAMLKLGMSLNALGAREQACATYAQLAVKYPEASQTVKNGVDRERQRARC